MAWALLLIYLWGIAFVIYYQYQFNGEWKWPVNVVESDGSFNPQSIPYYFIIVSINFLLLYPIAMASTRAIVFPYSCCISKNIILGSQASCYSSDFKMYAEKCYVLMQLRLLEKAPRDDFVYPSDYLGELKRKYRGIVEDY